MSREELQDEVVQSRAELGATLDQLTTRLSPGYQASQLARNTRRAATDAGTFLTGGGMPAGEPRRTRNATVIMSVAALAATVLAVAVARAVSRR
jgi:hypothetical protein